MTNAVNWFEIPAADFDRAKKFYETIFETELFQPDPSVQNAMFPVDWQNGHVGGGISAGQGAEPGPSGATVYLNGGDDLSHVLERVEGSGGKVVLPKTKIPMAEAGYMALFLDTEGNRVGLHSMG